MGSNPMRVTFSEIFLSFGGIYGMKKCHKCQKKKPLKDFPKNKSRVDGRSETCLDCKREYNRLHYENNKQYYIDKAGKAKQKLREWLIELKQKTGCGRCPESHSACLQFHHKDPAQKEFEICDALLTRGKDKILAEIEKCEVLCANCHLKLHYDLRQEM